MDWWIVDFNDVRGKIGARVREHSIFVRDRETFSPPFSLSLSLSFFLHKARAILHA